MPDLAVVAIGILSWLLMVPTLKNAVVGYLVGTSIAVIGLYIAFGIPVFLRLRAGEAFERGAWHLGNRYKWIDVLAIAWIILICILFMLPIAPAECRGTTRSTGTSSITHRLTVGGALLLFGGWYVLSAHKWFKGPVRQGDEQDLERIEAQYGERTAASPSAGS